jgi:hypothetical protein
MAVIATELALDEEEREFLIEALNGLLPSLREEVYKTERYEYRKRLQRREELLKSLLSRLSVPGTTRSV